MLDSESENFSSTFELEFPRSSKERAAVPPGLTAISGEERGRSSKGGGVEKSAKPTLFAPNSANQIFSPDLAIVWEPVMLERFAAGGLEMAYSIIRSDVGSISAILSP